MEFSARFNHLLPSICFLIFSLNVHWLSSHVVLLSHFNRVTLQCHRSGTCKRATHDGRYLSLSVEPVDVTLTDFTLSLSLSGTVDRCFLA